MAKTKALEQALVKSVVSALGIVERLAAFCNHHEETAARCEVMLVRGKVACKVSDALCKQSNLERSGTCVLIVHLEVVDVNFNHFIYWGDCGLIFMAVAIDLQGRANNTMNLWRIKPNLTKRASFCGNCVLHLVFH